MYLNGVPGLDVTFDRGPDESSATQWYTDKFGDKYPKSADVYGIKAYPPKYDRAASSKPVGSHVIRKRSYQNLDYSKL